MTENELLKIVVLIDKEKFLGLEDYEVGKAMYFVIQSNELFKKSSFGFLSLIKAIIKITCFRNVNVDEKFPQANKAFLFSNSYFERNDHKKFYDSVVSLVNNKTEFIHTQRLTFFKLGYFFKVLNWQRKFRKYFSKSNAWLYATILAKGFSDFKYIIDKLSKSNIKIITTLCDVHLIDSLVTQYCNKNGIKTATLQHGNLSAGPAYGFSKSDYFLGYGQYTKEIAVSSGLIAEKFVSVGMPQYIGKELRKSIVLNQNRVIGVIFCNYETIDDDTNMLNVVLDYASKNNYKVSVKIHPACGKSNYPNINWDNVDKVYGKEITVYDFMSQIDFAVISASTVFIEYIISLFPCFNYKCINDKYKSINWNKFSSIDEFSEKVSFFLSDKSKFEEKLKETRAYFTEVADINENYQNFYKKFDY